MKIRFLFLSLMIISILMLSLLGTLVKFTEVSSYFWSLHRNITMKEDISLLVLGDSQLISGLNIETISKRESIPFDRILFLARPSEQPEGMLDQFLNLKTKLPKLKKIYINLSPINVSQNSVTDAHKQLYFSFGALHFHQLTNDILRKAYFGSIADVVWKLVIEVFPFFGLNQNSSALFALVPSESQFYETTEMNPKSFRPNSFQNILETRYKNNQILKSHLENHKNWTWKAYSTEKSLEEKSVYPSGSALGFNKKRKISIEIIRILIEEAHRGNAKVACIDLPFSPPLEEDMKNHSIRKILDEEIASFDCDEYIKIGKDILSKRAFFTDFTHLNARGRDVLSDYFLNKKD